jgi:hypothetical protein
VKHQMCKRGVREVGGGVRARLMFGKKKWEVRRC